MSNEQGNEGLVFFASILSKMSQMFSEINSLYLQAMVNKKSSDLAPEFNVNQLFTDFEKEEEKNKVADLEEIADILQSENEGKHEEVKESPKKTKKETKKNKKEPNQSIKKPKQSTIQPPHTPPSSYLMFFSEHRSKIAEEFPNFSIAEQSKIAARCWKQLSDEQRKPYHDRFNEEKQKYYQELKIYNEMKSSEEAQKKNVAKPKDQKNEKKNKTEGKRANQKDKKLPGQSPRQDHQQSSELSSSITI